MGWDVSLREYNLFVDPIIAFVSMLSPLQLRNVNESGREREQHNFDSYFYLDILVNDHPFEWTRHWFTLASE